MDKRTIKQQARRIIESALDERGLYTEEREEGVNVSSVFLGTVFNIMPSGKYYMPFACSNVDECPHCKGKGYNQKNFKHSDGQEFTMSESCSYCGGCGSREAYEDELMGEYLDHYASKAGGWIESGEGDPCDMFICWNEENKENEEAQEA